MEVSEPVLTELSLVEVSPDGKIITLKRKMERTLYLAINKVLEALGGAWNRKAKGHVFSDDVRARLEGVLATGDVATAADLGFFETPEDLARRLVSMAEVRRGDFCLEPSAGKGRIVHELLDVGASVVAVERSEERRAVLDHRFGKRAHFYHTAAVDDFMAYQIEEPFDRVVMNPPFLRCGLGDHLDHVRRAYSMLVTGGVLVSILPTSITFRQDRRHKEFRAWAERRGEIKPLPSGSFKESGTGVNTCTLRLVGGAT